MSTNLTPQSFSRPRLEQWPISPQFISGYLINFCKWKFSRLENIQNPFIRQDQYLWKPDDLEGGQIASNIRIVSAHDWDPETAGQLPAVVIQRQATDFGADTSIGGNQYQTPTHLIGDGHNPNYQATLGQNQQLVNIQGSHRIMVLHHTGGGAEAFGEELWQTFIDYSTVIRKDTGLKWCRVGPLQAVGKLKEAGGDAYATPFVLNYSYQRATLIKQESPLIKSVSVSKS